MLSQLLTTKNKSEVVNLFLANPSRSFTLTEIYASTKCSQRMLIQTVRELVKMGFVLVNTKSKVRSYQIDKHFALYPELVSMLRKVKRLPQDLLVRELSKLKDCKVIILTGIFAGKPRIETDILLIGRVSERRLSKVLKLAEKFAEQEVNYTVMPPAEFEYRKIMNDRFIKNILENGPVLVKDSTKNKGVKKLVNRP